MTDPIFGFDPFNMPMPEPNTVQVGNTTISELPKEEPAIQKQYTEAKEHEDAKVGNMLVVETPILENKHKSTFQDLFWLTNPKLMAQKQLDENEAAFVTIAFNADFGNLRINLYAMPVDKTVVMGTKILFKNLEFLTHATLYPKACLDIINRASNYFPMEQLIADGTEDYIQTKLTTAKVDQTDDSITLSIQRVDGIVYHYTFTHLDLEALRIALRFTYTTGFELTLQNKIRKGVHV